ncbi:eCIS core domain-containing protein, partial [Streptomyces katsurahamanus]
RVRLHTDRDAGALTAMLGADAVAVGQDILFREGAYLPGTADGRRLLAHELLHTVQNPHGLGALRAGREPGAVSLPQQ